MHPAVNRSRLPAKNGERIMLGGILQIMVGRGCNESCFGCTQGMDQ